MFEQMTTRAVDNGFIELSRTERDFHIFCLWHRALPFVTECEGLLSKYFSMVARVTVWWSPELEAENFSRLYGHPPNRATGKEAHAGGAPFEVFIVEDKNPSYGLVESNSGAIEWQNLSVREAKNALRAKVGRPEHFLVHSSNSKREFWRDAHLILGADVLSELLGEGTYAQDFRKIGDLQGAGGWESSLQMLEFLNRTVDYVCLRPVSIGLGGSHAGGDIDILTWDINDLAALANAKIGLAGEPHWQVWTEIQGESVMLDLREVGDGDLFDSWQRRILETRTLTQGYFEPNDENRFFYLLHHLATEKSLADSKHSELVHRLGVDLGLLEREPKPGPFRLAKLLSRWLRTQKYFVSRHYGRSTRADPRLFSALGAPDVKAAADNARAQLRFLREIADPKNLGRGAKQRNRAVMRAGEIYHHIRSRTRRFVQRVISG